MKEENRIDIIRNVEINWNINDYCNFNCSYCYPDSKNRTFIGFKNIEFVAESFDKLGVPLLIYLSGGEPFLAPHFVELCQKLTENHIISINTNLSHSEVIRFAHEISPERVRCVHCSMHIEERERLGLVDDFIGKYNLLEEKGFYVFTSYVLHPRLLGRFETDYQFFKSKGIILRPKVLRGLEIKFNKLWDRPFLRQIKPYVGRLYPDKYSEQEKREIVAYIERSKQEGRFQIEHEEDDWKGRLSDVYYDLSFIDGLPSFLGKYCNAGRTFVFMRPNGDVYRCHSDNQYLGNLFTGELRLLDKIKPCRMPKCNCPYIGNRYIELGI